MHLGNLDWKGFVVLVDRCHESGKEDPEASNLKINFTKEHDDIWFVFDEQH